jgi:hypothetical protein
MYGSGQGRGGGIDAEGFPADSFADQRWPEDHDQQTHVPRLPWRRRLRSFERESFDPEAFEEEW